MTLTPASCSQSPASTVRFRRDATQQRLIYARVSTAIKAAHVAATTAAGCAARCPTRRTRYPLWGADSHHGRPGVG